MIGEPRPDLASAVSGLWREPPGRLTGSCSSVAGGGKLMFRRPFAVVVVSYGLAL